MTEVHPGRTSARPRVVIIGAGFAGINAAHELEHAPVDVTLVDRNNFNTFQPLLYQVATTFLPPEQVGAPLRSVFERHRNLEVRVGQVTGVDLDAREVQVDREEPLPYDYLVVTAGSTTNFLGIDGLEEHAFPLYTMGDAVRLRTHLLEQFEQFEAMPVPDPALTTVVVVGGGATGVETAGALMAMSRQRVGGTELRVVLVEALPRLLSAFSERSAQGALKDLRKRGVEVRLETPVASADGRCVTFKDGSSIDTTTVVFAAGVMASKLGSVLGIDLGKGGSIKVDPDLRVPGHPEVFAAGDLAAPQRPEGAQPFPLIAPNAIQQGKHVGKMLERLVRGEGTEPFAYFDKGSLAVIAFGDAIAEIPLVFGSQKSRTLKLRGRVAYLVWAGVHIFYLLGFRNRFKTLADWGWNALTHSGGNGILVRQVSAADDAT